MVPVNTLAGTEMQTERTDLGHYGGTESGGGAVEEEMY